MIAGYLILVDVYVPYTYVYKVKKINSDKAFVKECSKLKVQYTYFCKACFQCGMRIIRKYIFINQNQPHINYSVAFCKPCFVFCKNIKFNRPIFQ